MRYFKSVKSARATSVCGLCLLSLLLMPNLAVAEVVSGDLVLYLPMEDAISPSDVSDNPTTVHVHGSLTSVSGKLGTNGLEFNGQNANRIEVSNADKFDGLSALTVEAWVFPQNIASHEGMSIASKRIANQNADSFNLFTWTGQIVNARINAGGAVMSTTALQDNTWYHIAFVFDGAETGEESKLYINGVLEASGDHPDSAANKGIAPVWIGELDQARGFAWDGILDEVGIWNKALSEEDIHLLMVQTKSQILNGEIARNPMPSNGAEDVPVATDLSWTPGAYAMAHHVYVGSAFDDVNDQTVPTSEVMDANTYDPGRLEFGKTYFWRVDEVNGAPDKTVFKGAVWRFEAEPYSLLIPGSAIGVTASSLANEFSTPEKTIDGSGLGADDSHGMSAETMWFTASVDLDPWIQYEFDDVKKLDVMKVWNSNGAAESAIGWGVKDVQIKVSVDGQTWEKLADATQFSRAPGLPTYNQYDEIDFGGVAAKYVRLDIAGNWGGILMSYSLSEVQFNMIPTAARTPEPASGSVDVSPEAVVTWRAGREAAQHTIYVSSDQNAVADGTAPSVTSSTNSLDLGPLNLQLGETYYWRVDEVNEAEAVSVWAGPVWRFTTLTALIVDDFESYGNVSPDRPFQAWLDGFGYSADEFFPVGYGGNGTGAGIGHDIWSLSSPHYDGDIMETSNTLPGSGQSMPFYYGNSGGVPSETQHTFAVPQDWTVGGVKTLSIPFNGQAGNTGTLYAKINGVKVTYARDPANLALGGWIAFNIDLSSINVQSVTELSIGVDGSNVPGMLLIDDITLHSKAGDIIAPEDPGTDGLVASYSFEGNANDVSGNGNNGTVNGGALFVAGHDGSALDCDGIDDYVSTGKTASDLGIGGNGPRTISSWVFTRSHNNGGIYDMGARVTAQDFCLRTMATENLWRIQYWGGDSDFTLDTVNKWVHFTHVHDGVNTKIYANGVLLVDWAKTIDTPDTNPFQIGCYGWQVNYFDGVIDEVRVYNRAVSDGEALSLSGGTVPIDRPF